MHSAHRNTLSHIKQISICVLRLYIYDIILSQRSHLTSYRYSSGNCAWTSGRPRGTLVHFNRYKGCVTVLTETIRPDTNRQVDTNGDLCCQFMTSKLLFLLPYTFHRTCNLIGKSLTPRWNCLSCPVFFLLELYNQYQFIIEINKIRDWGQRIIRDNFTIGMFFPIRL